MAKRNRIPRRKSLGVHKRNRNQNPKLSPFQREQKRDRLANQPPVNKITRDFPASARKLQQFLSYQREVQDDGAADDEQPVRAVTSTPAAPKSKNKFKQPTPATPAASAAASHQGTRGAPASLNATLLSDAQPVDQNPLVKRLEKKMKLTLKKKEKRKAARLEQLNRESARLDAIIAGRPVEEIARTAMLSTRRRKTRKTEEGADDHSPEQEDANGAAADENSIEVPPPVVAAPPPRQPKEPTTRDFDDLIDVVGFGERNDAPPTFDVVPKANVALLPQHHIGKAKRAQMVETIRKQRIAEVLAAAGVASVASSSSNVTSTVLPDGSELVAAKVKGTRLESSDDFEALRQRVMARYAQKNQNFFQKRRNTIFDVAETTE